MKADQHVLLDSDKLSTTCREISLHSKNYYPSPSSYGVLDENLKPKV